ncbi:MAG: hypothetical protein AMXMBFR59_03160 [Rhodanobacteraceae bacterium]
MAPDLRTGGVIRAANGIGALPDIPDVAAAAARLATRFGVNLLALSSCGCQ